MSGLNKKSIAAALLEHEVTRVSKNGSVISKGKIKDRRGMTKELATDIVNAIFDGESGIIASALQAGKKVTIPGFGTFNTRYRNQRDGTHPSEKDHQNQPQKITIPSAWVVTFKVGKTLKENTNNR